ncbi:hypothetical protein GGQ59_002565 [Parvularcula dongshanensis]|uniref:Uncharacterized protein n=1 Tax=Parvularcula dongshanensis TaxID=1173995 RepID=A0A840I6Y3_9PROT|nr:hypothetical protein [Parvularcula dongshanensis]
MVAPFAFPFGYSKWGQAVGASWWDVATFFS